AASERSSSGCPGSSGSRAARARGTSSRRCYGWGARGKLSASWATTVLGPSYTLDLARKVWAVLPRTTHSLYHLTSGGQTSWYDFARRAFELAGVTADITPVTATEFGARARRPAYSVLGHAHLAALGEDDLRPWDAALAAYIAERSSSPSRPP